MSIFSFIKNRKRDKELISQYKKIIDKQDEQIKLLKGWISILAMERDRYEEQIKFHRLIEANTNCKTL